MTPPPSSSVLARWSTRQSSCLVALAFGAAAIACTAPPPEEETLHVRLSSVGNGNGVGHGSGNLSGGISITGADGEPVDGALAQAHIEVFTRGGDGWEPARDVEVHANARPSMNVMLVADNSGGLSDDIDDIQDALSHFSRIYLRQGHPDRLGLVRVSTEARVVQPLTRDRETIQGAIDSLFVTNGWTALWDGFRIANQELHTNALAEQADGSTCYSGTYSAIVAMTDGMENNSAGQESTRYPGDGVDTYFEDIVDLRAGFRRTTVHSVGVGSRIDKDALRELAEASGGAYHSISEYAQLTGTLRKTVNQLKNTAPICFRPADCSHEEVRISVALDTATGSHRAEFTTAIEPSCPE